MTPRPMYMQIPVEEYETLKKTIETMAAELEELRNHEHAWDLDKDKIKELEARQRWHKTSEEQPNENDYYLVTSGDAVYYDAFMEYGYYSEQDEEWQWEHNGKWEYWMPLPEPPKEATK